MYDSNNLDWPGVGIVDDQLGTLRPEAQGFVCQIRPAVADWWVLREYPEGGQKLETNLPARPEIVLGYIHPNLFDVAGRLDRKREPLHVPLRF